MSAEIAALHQHLGNASALHIINLGAHYGWEIPSFYRLLAPGGRLHQVLVEPDVECAHMLRQNFPREYLIEAAISDVTGYKTFYPATDGSGSLRRRKQSQLAGLKFGDPRTVQCYTLDDLCERHDLLRQVDLLWVDIQGAEREMIKGGQKTLARTRYCFMEVERKELYEGEALRDELLGMLPAWKVVAEFEYNVLLKNERLIIGD